MKEKELYLQDLSDTIYEMDEDEIVDIAKAYIEAGYDAHDAVNLGLVDGMNRVGEAYEEEEYFVTDLLFASDAMYAALDYLQPYLTEDAAAEKAGVCVIGNVEGDTHDIGKNLVKTMLEASGFEMHDLGKDVPVDTFISKAEEVNADIICISTLMTTTMPKMREVLETLEEKELRQTYKVMIGGGPVNQAFADEIGADGYSENATEAVRLAEKLMKIEV